MKSIRIKLSVFLFLSAIATAAIIGVITYHHTLTQNEQLFDYQLRQMALSLRDQGEIVRPAFPRDANDEETDIVVQIWTATGTIAYMSRPGGPLLDRAILGYADVEADQRRWRVYSLAARDRIIQVAQPLELRRDLAAAAALRSLAPLLAFAPLMALLIWLIAGSSLSSLKRLVNEVGEQDVRALKPVSRKEVPTEIAPLIVAFNALLARVNQALASQRAFVADAAHELRSPLTALKLQLQLLARASDPDLRSAALEKLHAGVDRATHLIEQLLIAARTDPAEQPARLESVDLAELARHAIADVFPFAQERNMEIDLEAQDRILIPADPDTLRILIRNLIDNAVRHAPRNTPVHVSVMASEGSAVLTIEDAGPGIADAERQRVFDRFYRIEKNEETDGSGLGLSIVKNIADQHGAKITLDRSAMGGLKATLVFKTAADASK